MSSSWATKFEKKLTALADGASKESIQTLATWMVFNRKHAQAFANVLLQHLTATSATTSRQALYWQLIHQVFVSNKEDHDKWDRTLDLRIIVGESVVLVALPDLIATAAASTTTTSSNTADLVEGMIKEWDQHNVFGGPTLIGQIKRILVTARSKTTTSGTTTTASSSEAVVAVTAANSTTNSTAVEAGNPPDKEGRVPATTATTTITSTATANTIPSPMIIETSRSSPATRRASLSSVGSSSTHGKQRRGSLSSVQSEQLPIDYDFDSTVRTNTTYTPPYTNMGR
jgi:hypothetical protein